MVIWLRMKPDWNVSLHTPCNLPGLSCTRSRFVWVRHTAGGYSNHLPRTRVPPHPALVSSLSSLRPHSNVTSSERPSWHLYVKCSTLRKHGPSPSRCPWLLEPPEMRFLWLLGYYVAHQNANPCGYLAHLSILSTFCFWHRADAYEHSLNA